MLLAEGDRVHAEDKVRLPNSDCIATTRNQEYFSFAELAQRWRCSRATVYNRLRVLGAEVLDFAPRGKRGRKVIPTETVIRIEKRGMKRLQ